MSCIVNVLIFLDVLIISICDIVFGVRFMFVRLSVCYVVFLVMGR